MPSFSVVRLWHKYAHSHPNRGSKYTHQYWRSGRILLKDVLLKLIFQDQGYLHVSCLFYMLSIYCQSLLFQFLSHGIRMHITILTWNMDNSLAEKTVIFYYKCTFSILISKWKVTWMPITSFIFLLFNLNPFFSVLGF